MINRILGKIVETQSNMLILETLSGLFYEIEIPYSNLIKIKLHEKYLIYTTLIINETQQRLFGFINQDDNLIFRKIIKIIGIGPKTALSILDKVDHTMLKQCSISNDFSILLTVNGIGNKTYKKIVSDIKSVISREDKPKINDINIDHGLKQEATIALMALGYKGNYEQFINKALNETDNISNVIKVVLQYISGTKK